VKKEQTGPLRVLVFPTCSEPGLEIVRALIDQPGLEIVGGSSLPPSQDPSSLILRHHVTIPWLGAGEFRDALMNILGDYRIQVVFPATDGLIAALSGTDMGDVFVSDGTDPSPQEIREQLPGILVATPDTLELLGWERLGANT